MDANPDITANLVSKLNHRVEEIRVRALLTITSKLDHGILDIQDLEGYHSLPVHLLQWFNLPSCPEPEVVLSLIYRLVVDSNLASVFVHIGAVEFLKALRDSLPSILHVTVDVILSRLHEEPSAVRTPSLVPPEWQKCTYLQQPSTDIMVQDPQRQIQQPDGTRPLKGTSSHEAVFSVSVMHTNAGVLRLEKIPWVSLTSSDSHILASTTTSLQSTDANLVVSSCEFLCHVVFKDFPPEVFLQRPAIAQALISVMGSNDSAAREAAVKCLLHLVQSLRARIATLRDPINVTDKFNDEDSGTEADLTNVSLVASDRPSSEVAGINRHDGDGQEEAVFQARLDSVSPQRMILPEFCCMVSNHTVSLLKDCTLYQASIISQLLLEVMALLQSHGLVVWEDADLDKVRSLLQDSLLKLGEMLTFYREAGVRNDAQKFRLLYLTAATVTYRFLMCLAVPEKSYHIVPKQLRESLIFLLMDESWRLFHPVEHSMVLSYVRVYDSTAHMSYLKSEDLRKSIEAVCHFLKSSKSCMSESQSLLKLAEDSALALTILPCAGFARPFFEVCVKCCRQMGCIEETIQRSRAVILKLLTHEDYRVRGVIYSLCQELVAGTSANCDQWLLTQTASFRDQFLFNHRVLYQITGYGMSDTPEIVEEATSLLCGLLHSRSLVSAELWQSFMMSCLLPVFPILQSFISFDTALGRLLFDMINPRSPGKEPCLSSLQIARSHLRCLMLLDQQIRSDGLELLLDSDYVRPTVLSKIHPGFSNILLTQKPRKLPTMDSHSPHFNEDGVKKLLDIVRNGSLDMDIRYSAMQQLSIVLEDRVFHKFFKANDGLYLVEKTVKQIYAPDSCSSEEYRFIQGLFPACIHVLSSFVLNDSVVRRQFAHDPQVYHSIIWGLFHHEQNISFKQTATELLMFLLFDEIFEAGHGVLALPRTILEHYCLPICVTALEDETVRAKELLGDPNYLDIVWERLRYCWNISWLDGASGLESMPLEAWNLPDDPGPFRLHPAEATIIYYTCPCTAVRHLFNVIMNATAHRVVRTALEALSLQVLINLPNGNNAFFSLNWKEVFGRFFQAPPMSAQDEDLLASVVAFLALLLYDHCALKEQVHKKLWHWLISTPGPLQQLLCRVTDAKIQPKDNCVNRNFPPVVCELLAFASLLLEVVSSCSGTAVETLQLPNSSFAKNLVIGLGLAGTPHFYSLALLETILTSLLHITAKPGWSVECAGSDGWNLCKQMLVALMEVTTAFHFGHGNSSTGSYMGKGVTRATAVCLSHLAEEMATLHLENGWEAFWVHEQPSPREVQQLGLSWLFPLWMDRDPQVRTATLCTAVSLTRSCTGCQVISGHLREVVGGIWGLALTFLLDKSEASSVREQAAMLLCNLTSEHFSDQIEQLFPIPFVPDVERQDRITGIQAFEILLQHGNFCKGIIDILNSYCRHIFFYLDITTELQLEPVQHYFNSGDRPAQQTTVPTSSISIYHLQDNQDQVESLLVDSSDHLPSVTTAGLGTGVFYLLYNLLLADSPHVSSNIQDLWFSVLKCLELNCCVADKLDMTTQNEVALMSSAAVAFLNIAIMKAPNSKSSALEQHNFLQIILSLLRLKEEPAKTPLRVSVFRLIADIFDGCSESDWQQLWPHVVSNWHHFISSLKDALIQTDDQPICMSASRLLSSFCRVHMKWKTNKPKEMPKSVWDSTSGNFMKDICKALMFLRQKVVVMPLDATKDYVDYHAGTLSLLLGSSADAKSIALEDGLIGLVSVELAECADLATDILLESQEQSKMKIGSRLAVMLSQRLEMLQNIMYEFQAAKLEACHQNFATILSTLWPFAVTIPSLMCIYVTVLGNFTAGCPPACRSLVSSHCGSDTLLQRLLHLMTCDIERVGKPRPTKCLQVSFQVLSNVCQVKDCIGIIARSGFFEKFVQISKGQHKRQIELWLYLLSSVTSSKEGQRALLDTRGALNTLIEITQFGTDAIKVMALRVLATICAQQSNKSKLLASDLLTQVIEHLHSENEEVAYASAVAVWGLLSNCQRAKSELSCNAVLETRVKRAMAASRLRNSTVADMLESVLTMSKTKSGGNSSNPS